MNDLGKLKGDYGVDMSRILTNLAAKLVEKRKDIEAEPMLKRAVMILCSALGENDVETKAARGALGELYRRHGKANEGSRICMTFDVNCVSGLMTDALLG